MNIDHRYDQLVSWIRPFGTAAVAFSGGIDSGLVLRLACDALGPSNVLAITSAGPALPQREREHAQRFAAEIGAAHRWVEAAEIESAAYRANAADRCLHCKTHLYSVTSQIRDDEGFAVVFNGTNADDLGDHRPGLQAAETANVRSPLAENAVDKKLTRLIARQLGLSAWNKPAAPCLASRVPYGTPVTRSVLAQIEAVEDRLHALGFRVFRARHYGDEVRIEVPVAEIPRAKDVQPDLLQAAKIAGFSSVSIDPRGFSSGSLNRALPIAKLRAGLGD